MKQRILIFILAAIMLMGMSTASYAENTKYYEGVGMGGGGEVLNATFTVQGNNYTLCYTTEYNGINYELQFVGAGMICHPSYGNIPGYKLVSYNGEAYTKDYYLRIDITEDTVTIRDKVSDMTIYNHMELEFTRVNNSQVVNPITTPFAGVAESDRGEYSVAIAGHFIAELADGTYTLSSDEINQQTISVVACRKVSGVTRVMKQNTIEEMSVTVSGGRVTDIVIRGRAQTNGAKVDYYTASIHQ